MTLPLFGSGIPRMPTLEPRRCHVAEVTYATVKTVLAEAHYLGLYVDNALAGVITFGTIPKNNASSICGPDRAPSVLELTRLALYDWAPKNSESWFIAHAIHELRRIRPDIHILISYADQSVGHVGTIYQATNWLYTGASTNDVVYVCETGEVLHPRTIGRRKGDLPAGKWRAAPAKHRYVKFLGSRTYRHALAAEMRWESLPYPRLDLDLYDKEDVA
jgi:hypothetical protein